MPNHDFRQKAGRPRLILVNERPNCSPWRTPAPAPSLDLERVAQSLGCEAHEDIILAPAPCGSLGDRSLVVEPNRTAPHGYVCFSRGFDDPTICREHVRQRLGLPPLPRLPRLRAIAGELR
jgi:hypothetical protein